MSVSLSISIVQEISIGFSGIGKLLKDDLNFVNKNQNKVEENTE